MKKAIILVLIFLSPKTYAQLPIDWAVCVEEKNYSYTNAHIKDFKKINKRMKFCYNDHYFGFINSKDNYLQVFPLESYNMGTDFNGNVTEGFTNGDCPNFERGDIDVTITHGKPQTILINYSRQPSYAIYIYTNSLYVQKYKNKKQPKQDTLITTSVIDKSSWPYCLFQSGTGNEEIREYVKKYVEYIKLVYLDKYFGCKIKGIQTYKFKDNKTGKNIKNISNYEWKCTNIAVSDSDNPIKVVYTLDNNIGNEIVASMADINEYFLKPNE